VEELFVLPAGSKGCGSWLPGGRKGLCYQEKRNGSFAQVEGRGSGTRWRGLLLLYCTWREETRRRGEYK